MKPTTGAIAAMEEAGTEAVYKRPFHQLINEPCVTLHQIVAL